MTETTTNALDSGRMTIWEHLAELRNRIIKCALAVAVGMCVGFAVYGRVVEFLVEPYKQIQGLDQGLYSPDLLEPFFIRMQTSLYLGIAIAMPVILWQLWRFITPGLYPHEKRYAIPFVVSATLLFILGGVIAYLSLAPTINFLVGIAGFDVHFIPSIDSYLKLNLFMMLAFGAGFEFPVLLVALQIAGILKPRQLLGWWRYATVTVTIVAAVITPGGDPISMLALAVPMEILYFMAIGIGALLAWRKGRKQPADTGT